MKKILLTGAGGYIGTRLIQKLGESKYKIYALVRSSRRIKVPPHLKDQVEIIEADLLDPATLKSVPKDIDAAYYLVHSMGKQSTGFKALEERCASNFVKMINQTDAKQIIYLSGLSSEKNISEHMGSRHRVEEVLIEAKAPLTTLRAGIVIGSGSASFEIIRDLVEKLPVMVTPKWVNSRCQPIAISDVLYYLENTLLNNGCLGKTFEIGGPDTLTYKEMILRLAKCRKLKRYIFTVPVLTPKLSSLWLYFITSTNFSIAKALVNSLKTDAVCSENTIEKILPHKCLTLEKAIDRAFEKIEQNAVVSSWKDALVQSHLNPRLTEYIKVPETGCLKEIYDNTYPVPKEAVMDRLFSIGGKNGWYYLDFLWAIRGYIDRLIGGVGLRRGRTHPTQLKNGDVLDFWRVLLADKENGRLLLYAEMRIPGDAWLEWKITGDDQSTKIKQTATFRPRGVLGRIYWYALMPFHAFIFSGLCNSLAKVDKHK